MAYFVVAVYCSYLCWDDYFMAVAFLSAERSKDPNKQVSTNCWLLIIIIGHQPRAPKKTKRKRCFIASAITAKLPLTADAAPAETPWVKRIHVVAFSCFTCELLLPVASTDAAAAVHTVRGR
jgi:hypothetical protein